MKRCGKRYGNRRDLICRRPVDHGGSHAKQMTVRDLRAFLRMTARGDYEAQS